MKKSNFTKIVERVNEETEYKTDKYLGWSFFGDEPGHCYTEVYDFLLSPRKEEIKRVMEVGIAKGGSVIAWSAFFPDATITAVDIIPCDPPLESGGSIEIIIDDAYTENFVYDKMAGRKFDLIVDDGPHTLESQTFFAQHYKNLLSENGILIIEDFKHGIDSAHHLCRTCFNDPYRTMIIDRRYATGSYNEIQIVLFK